MRLATRSTQSLLEQRREQLRRKRAAAGTLANAFPDVGRVRVELSFTGTAGPAPATQSHFMYPAAPAYFEFACPYGDCDGSFDLNEIATSLMAEEAPQTKGTIDCAGGRTSGGMTRRPCGLRASYWIVAQYQRGAGS